MRRVVVLLALAGAAAPMACTAFSGEDEDEVVPATPIPEGGVDGTSHDGSPLPDEEGGGISLPFDAGPILEDAASCKAICADGTKCTVDGRCRVDVQATCGSPIFVAAPATYVGRVCKSDGTSSIPLCPEMRLSHAFRIGPGIGNVTIEKVSGSIDFTSGKTCASGGCSAASPTATRSVSANDHVVVGTGVVCSEYRIVFAL